MAPFQSLDLPILKSTRRLGGKGTDTRTPIFDVQFWPYEGAEEDPVFAVTGEHNTLVCRPTDGDSGEEGTEVLQWFHDQDALSQDQDGNPLENLNSLAWTYDEETHDPLLCVAGHKASIKILNVKTGCLERELPGHGGAVNDISVHPECPQFIATGSEDFTVRVWDLRAQSKKQPTALICAGEGHRAGILTVAFHHTGRWLLSGGFDTKINLWAVPSLHETSAANGEPKVVHYPHFSSMEIHASHVDSISFYDDLILSKSATENKIILWRIVNFKPSDSPVPPAPANSYGRGTRSAFVPAQLSPTNGYDFEPPAFEILLTFETPSTNLIYMRFGLSPPSVSTPYHPLLAIGNIKSRVHFWDLQALEEGIVNDAGTKSTARAGSHSTTASTGATRGRKPKRGAAAAAAAGPGGVATLSRAESVATTTSSSEAREGSLASAHYPAVGASGGGASASRPAPSPSPALNSAVPATGADKDKDKDKDKSKSVAAADQTRDKSAYPLGDPYTTLKAHKIVMVPSVDFASRAVAWSPGSAEWCVVVGDHGMICVFKRTEAAS